MKPIKYFRNAWRLAALLALLMVVGGALAQEYNRPAQQPDRFLLVFETSPVLKKNLTGLKQILASLFAGNLQNQMHMGDDLAVWTVGKELHTGTFEMESWSPDEAEDYTERLSKFLKDQDYTRHASLAPLGPPLDHVVKSSDHLTVLIFCDSESRLVGTPYDDGVNEIMTNAAARLKSERTPFIVVLRAYHGEYIGCSVNRSAPLNLPQFPVPPKPVPALALKSAPPPSAAVAPPVSGPVVTPVSAMIIVGTNASASAAARTQPPFAPGVAQAPPPAPITTPAPAVTPQTAPSTTTSPAPPPPQSIILTGPPPAPTPAPVQPTPQQPAPTPTPAAPPTPASGVAPASTQPEVPPSEKTDAGFLVPLVIAGGALVAAVVIVVWLLARSRRPQGSLITSSMRDDPRLGPKK